MLCGGSGLPDGRCIAPCEVPPLPTRCEKPALVSCKSGPLTGFSLTDDASAAPSGAQERIPRLTAAGYVLGPLSGLTSSADFC